MPDAANTAIKSALLNRYNAFQYSSPDTLYRAQPNVALTPPDPSSTTYWLRATILPADTFAMGLDPGASNQHYGVFQIDVFYGLGSGELKPGRLADEVIAWFKRGTKLTKDGFKVEIGVGDKIPRQERAYKDDPWYVVPVSIPYRAFASNPA